MEPEQSPKSLIENGKKANGENGNVNVDPVENMEVEVIPSPSGDLNGNRNRKLSETNHAPKGDTSPSSAQPTPKRRKIDKAEKEAERLKREEEKRIREQERLEKLRVKEEERLRREEEKKRKEEEKEQERQKREEEKRQREEEKKRKDEEKEQERLKREEEKRQREEEKKRKEEEREQERLRKEEEKRKHDEERRKKEEERLQREAEKKQAQEKIEKAKQKQANFMSKFLQITPSRKDTSLGENKTSPDSSSKTPNETPGESSAKKAKTPEVIDLENEIPKSGPRKNLLSGFNSEALFNAMPFQVKTNMALAPSFRRVLSSEEKTLLDQIFAAPDEQPVLQLTYLQEIKSKQIGKSGKTLVKPNNVTANQEDEVEVVYDKSVNEAPITDPPLVAYHFKLLQFHENRRPAYWGTWKTKPKKITGRRPFRQEEEVDYDFDSDDEWEDEPDDAEELKSEKESDDEDTGLLKNDDDDDDDEGWMVPHGYLSEDEGPDAKVGGEKKVAEAEKEDAQIKLCDKDALKKQEEVYYKEIQFGKKLGLPYIQTDNLSAYRVILFTKKKERRIAKRGAATPFYEILKDAKEGRLPGLYEGYPSSDEEDSDWSESEDDDDEVSLSSDSDVEEDPTALLEELDIKLTTKSKSKGAVAMDTS